MCLRVSGEIEVNCAIPDEEKNSKREGRENKSPPPFSSATPFCQRQLFGRNGGSKIESFQADCQNCITDTKI